MYDFRTLSPLDLEELVRDLLQAELGVRIESFGPGRDLGIDFRFATAQGSVVIQVKHYPDARTDELVRIAARENAKVGRLQPSRYIFATSANISPQGKEKILEAIPSAPLDSIDIIGRADLNNLIGRHPSIEKRHFKLWLASAAVLERILHSGVYNRTEAEMDEIRAMVPKFVQNDSLPQAEAILQEHGVLIIAGEPGIGKSTLARMLVWLHAERDWRISVIDEIAEAFEVADGTQKKLIFFDDFLGQVALTKDLIRGIDQRFPPFFRRVKANQNLRFILTTRDYILAQAQAQSSRIDSVEVNSTEFILNVGFFTRYVRAKMLYNHIYFSDLSDAERAELIDDDYFLKIVDHKNFNPRLIDLLTRADYVSITGKSIRDTVMAVLGNPEELWEKPYRAHMSEEARALMLAQFFNSQRVRIGSLEQSFGRLVTALGFVIPQSDVPQRFRAALKELEGSILSIQDRMVAFSNPGIRDFLQRVVQEDRLLPAVVGVVTDFDEVYRAWEFRMGQGADRSGNDAALWASAVRRLLESGSGSALRQLSLIVSMHDTFANDDFVPLVRTAVSNLDESAVDFEEADLGQDVLELLEATCLPEELKLEARHVASKAVEDMVAGCGMYFGLDELEAMATCLSKYAVDEDAAAEAIRAAIEEHVSELDEILGGMKYVSQVEEYQEHFSRLADEYGVTASRVTTKFESRKEDILEEGEPNYDEEGYGYRGSGDSAGSAADDQIRSMFSGLKT